MALNVETLNQITILFNKKKWPIERETDTIGSLYGRFCKRLDMLNQEEQNLVLSLAEDFIYITFADLYEQILSSFYSVNEDIYINNNKIIIAPLKDYYIIKEDGSRSINTKSHGSDMIWLLFSRTDFRWMDYSYKFIACNQIDKIKHLYNNKCKICLIDDFVGTGETAKSAIDQLIDISGIQKKDIFILSLISQESGVKYLTNNDIISFSNKTIKRGISDCENYSEEQISKLLVLMQNIERKIDKKIPESENTLGYKKSEALVSILDKSPNNTFPIFWYETKSKVAIFPRYKNLKIE